MPLRRPRFPDERDPHVATRTLACMVGVLLLGLGAVRYWPAGGPPEVSRFDTERELLDPMQVVEILPTRQPPPPANLPPPPPPLADADLPPVEVEDLIDVEDVLVDRFEVDVPAPQPSAPGPPAPPAPPAPPRPAPGPARAEPAAPSGPTLVRQPDTVPRYRFVPLPEYPEAARREGVRARAGVEVLVTEGGRVETAEIVDRVVIRGRDREERVPRLPHGMDEVALATARRYVFSPARHGGRIVRTYTRITLEVGEE